MADDGGAASAVDEKEKRRRKQSKRMGKILAKAWAIKGSEPFQEERHSSSKEGHALDLTTIGQKIDEQHYRLGRHGWEDFARDLGGVYNRHMDRNTKYAETASNHIKNVKDMLGQKDQSLADLAKDFVPSEASAVSKKRKASEDAMDSRISRRKSSSRSISDKVESGDGELSLKDREARAMDQLAAFIEERGGSREQVAGFRSRVTRKPSDRRYDVNFYNTQGRRFRSMMDVGRFLNLVKNERSTKRKAGFKKNKPQTSREKEAEKRKLRKELERLRKAHQRAIKALDDFTNDQKESRYPMEDLVLMEKETQNGTQAAITPQTCAAARIPDIQGFPGVPQYCIPDLLMSWDFLCTFHTSLDLEPISLDDFASALTYQPPTQMDGDDIQSAPVYVAEAHLGLLKLLVKDNQSDEWWWSILETHESEISKDTNAQMNLAVEEKEGEQMTVIRVDMNALLSEEEDPLITNSWLTALEDVRNSTLTEGETMKQAVKTALGVVANKWVAAYLKKTLKMLKRKDFLSTRRAILWLVDRVKEARPDLFTRSVRESRILEIRAKIVEEARQQMEKLSNTAPTVKDDDVASDVESDDESDESDEEEMGTFEKEGEDLKRRPEKPADKDESELPASVIPPRPAPTLVDLLLPPLKPHPNSEFVNVFSWPQLSGAAAQRIFHRYKRLRNEVDDELRAKRELPQLTVSERRQREKIAASRIFTECCVDTDGQSPVESAVDHLCSGGDYLALSPVQRLCVIRMMIEAAYDTEAVNRLVSDNLKARQDASKLVDKEEKRAKKEAKEKAASDEATAREQLAADARNKFLEEKRAEIKKINEKSNEFTEEFMDSLTDEDIIEFDEDIKADYEALPGPESFNKTEVKEMVKKMQEAAAFDTHSLRVLSMEELLEQEKEELKEMEVQLLSLTGDSSEQLDSTIDRETTRTIERLKKKIEKTKQETAETLPESRALACAILQDAIADGTIKVLKSALREAKHAKLSGEDETTGGVWALNLMRDAALELENAKQHKRVADAQKDLVTKRNKCFIRTEPLGRDRFRNRFWQFEVDERSHFWAEVNYLIKDKATVCSAAPPPGFLNLIADRESVFVGAKDAEEDLVSGGATSEQFACFSRQEYHSSGSSPCLANRKWGCHATEQSIRTLIKSLDGRGTRENGLKTNLKEALEEDVGSGEKHENGKEVTSEDTEAKIDAESNKMIGTDEEYFQRAKELERESDLPRDNISMDVLDKIKSGIGQQVRVRVVLATSKDSDVVKYENGEVSGWRNRREKVRVEEEMDVDEEEAVDPQVKVVEVQEWEVFTDRGHTYWLSAPDLLKAICRYAKWHGKEKGYFEADASFLTYRNSIGKHCGRAAEAHYASSPMMFARMMVKREQELYSKLKNRNYDNNWGGKSGARAVWTNSMKDYTFDFQSAREGLLTLENAFYELMGGDPEDGKNVNGQKLLENPATRDDIELESIDSKSIKGLWNSSESRAVFYSIVRNCKTTGFLALAFDLMCRNTIAYLSAHKLLHVAPEPVATSTRSSRRMNAWQQANLEAGFY